MKFSRFIFFIFGLSAILLAAAVDAANHREAPLTAFDHKADITDVYAFRSYGTGSAAKSL
jgi:hypothetical protein